LLATSFKLQQVAVVQDALWCWTAGGGALLVNLSVGLLLLPLHAGYGGPAKLVV
jgi:hypothetical protein